MIKVSTTGMAVSLKTDLRFPESGQHGHGSRIIQLDQIIMCLYVEVICKIQTMYVTNLRSGLEYIVKEQNDLAKDYYKKIAQPVRV